MEDRTEKTWWRNLPNGLPIRDDLVRLIEEGGGRYEVENEMFEDFNDPTFRVNETAERRFSAQMRRRLRHRESRGRQ